MGQSLEFEKWLRSPWAVLTTIYRLLQQYKCQSMPQSDHLGHFNPSYIKCVFPIDRPT